jgi:hypothetical protein
MRGIDDLYLIAKNAHLYGAPELNARTSIVQIFLFGFSDMDKKKLTN